MAAAKKAAAYKVIGPAVVLPTVGRSERYLYRGAHVDASAYTEEGIAHAVGLGLLAPVEGKTEDEAAE